MSVAAFGQLNDLLKESVSRQDTIMRKNISAEGRIAITISLVKMNADAGLGLQVVDVVGPCSYALNEEALGALLREEVRDLPVAVLSVAGAFRGGKSFLLDFILRYLLATDTERRSDAWLGSDQDPLVGFDWRTGAQRNTIGIHIWSHLFPMTLPSGEKVAVVLMDTQGTFDNESSMQESTTIFSLSTLLSSVQIYNITGNLKGDDLQHLQLFTEYARLVLNDAVQPFQHLKFLIRDWIFTLDQPFGAEGGKRLLERVLQVKAEQPEQQQEIRRHLRSCFQDLDCFLMAHPGFAVSDANFKGRLADLRPEFKACLLELIPLLLAPARLVPKRINGQRLTAQEFVLYFRTYLDVFNSGELPTPATILQATAEVGLLLATEAARAQYISSMAACADERLLSPGALYHLHADAVAAARQLFTSRKVMASRQNIDEALAKITKEFDGRLLDLIAINEAKMSKTFESAMEAYVAEMLGGVPEAHLCASPAALAAAHRAASAAVAKTFSEKLHPDGEDKQTPQLLKDLNARYSQMVQFNELNNNGNVSGAFDVYVAEMDMSTNGGQSCMSDQLLNSKHALAHEAAKNFLRGKRNRDSVQTEDIFFERLDKDIKVQYKKYDQLNKRNNESVVFAVLASYNNRMIELFGTHMKCLPPGQLTNGEENVRRQAIAMYRARRTTDDNENNDTYLSEIEELMTRRYELLVEWNKVLNAAAVQAGRNEYHAIMGVKTEGLPLLLRPFSVVMAPLRLLQLWMDLNGYHAEAKNRAIAIFESQRCDGSVENNDTYYQRLITEIENLYDYYKNPFRVVARDLGIAL